MESAAIPPQVVWLTGLPAAGKTTIANELHRALRKRGQRSWVLDGDQLRNGLNADLGFNPADRAENVRRVAHVARILLDAGLVVIVALVSPFHADRRAARQLFHPDEFLEVWVKTPLTVCRQRDPKGLYAMATAGQLAQMTGVGQVYEPPTTPSLVLNGTDSAPENAHQLLCRLTDRASGCHPDQP